MDLLFEMLEETKEINSRQVPKIKSSLQFSHKQKKVQVFYMILLKYRIFLSVIKRIGW